MKPTSRRLGLQVTPEAAVSFTRLTVCLTCIWAPSGKLSLIFFKGFFWASLLLALGIFFPLVFSIVKFRDDTFVVLKSFISISGVVNFVIKVIICRIYRNQFQKLGKSLTNFIKNSTENEKLCLQKYVDKCWKFHGYMTCSYYLATTVMLMGPIFLPGKFPCDAVYPFSVDHPAIATVVYVHQCFTAYQCSAGMAVDCQAALFLWYLCVRFELLISETENITNIEEMREFVKTHQEILRFAEEVVRPIRLIVLTTITMTKVGMIFGAIVLISDEPFTVKAQFAILVLSATINIYVCTWAADFLITISSKTLSDEIFDISWVHHPKIRKMWVIVILRAQKPVVISIPGLLSSLSNEYYSSFLSAAFSAFATMRVVMN